MTTDLKAIQAALDKHWTGQMRRAAAREGWFLTTASFSPLEVQKIDEPDNWKQHYGFTPPTLDSDDVACVMVRTGTGPHHLIARQLVAAFNEPEFNRWTTLPGVAEHWATPGLGEVAGVSANIKPTPPVMVVGGRYNWRGQAERLVYVGFNWSGNGRWHQFELVDKPGKVWCEVQPDDLAMFEETKPAAPATEHDIRSAGVSPHNGEHWYKCAKCGSSDWIAGYGTPDQLNFYSQPCVPQQAARPDLDDARARIADSTSPRLPELQQRLGGIPVGAGDGNTVIAYKTSAMGKSEVPSALVTASCPDSDNIGIHDCGNAGQCFEPCGQLGHDEKHVVAGTSSGVDNALIRNVFIAHGFTIKSGQSDLKPYVYDAAHALILAVCRPHLDAIADTRQALGEALTSKLAEMCKDGVPDWFDAAHTDEVLDVLMPHIEVLPDSTCETEAQGFAWEAIHQFVPELQCRDDSNLVLTPAQAEQLLRRMGWMPPGEKRAYTDGDVLPPLGSTVYILHGRDDNAHACSVTGYFAWPSRNGDRFAHRVFVTLVYLGTTTPQSRHLSDVFQTKEAALASRQANPR